MDMKSGTVDSWLNSMCYYRNHIANKKTCLFQAVAEQLFYSQLFHERVRQDCISYGKKHSKEFKHLVRKKRDWFDRLKKLSINMLVCTDMEIQLVCKTYDVDITIFTAEDRSIQEFKCHPLYTGYQKLLICKMSEDHYNAVYDKKFIAARGFCQYHRHNSNQNVMNSLQIIRFLWQCKQYNRLRNKLAIMLAHQKQHSQLLPNTPAQNIQQKCRKRGSIEVQRQSIDSSNIAVDGVRRQAQQRPMVSGIQPPIAHASDVPHSALQQKISIISNHSVVPKTPVRANVSWIPNQNVAPAAYTSPSFVLLLPPTQQLPSLQTIPSEQPTQAPLVQPQPQTIRTFNSFPYDLYWNLFTYANSLYRK